MKKWIRKAPKKVKIREIENLIQKIREIEDNFYFSLFQNIETPEQPVIPDSIRFDPSKSLENKPKGLVDSLSKFFTPGMKRTSRTALSTLIKPPSELETATPINKKRKALFTSSGDDEGIFTKKNIMKW